MICEGNYQSQFGKQQTVLVILREDILLVTEEQFVNLQGNILWTSKKTFCEFTRQKFGSFLHEHFFGNLQGNRLRIYKKTFETLQSQMEIAKWNVGKITNPGWNTVNSVGGSPKIYLRSHVTRIHTHAYIYILSYLMSEIRIQHSLTYYTYTSSITYSYIHIAVERNTFTCQREVISSLYRND